MLSGSAEAYLCGKNEEYPNSTPKSVAIVAIGASASGQKAVVELLKSLSPTTGLAYVYIQHPDPTQSSQQLTDVLGKATAMTAQEAEHLLPIEPNHLYVIPPDRDLEVLDGVLTLQPRPSRSVINMPIAIWVPACLTGQEAYSLAMLLLEAQGERP